MFKIDKNSAVSLKYCQEVNILATYKKNERERFRRIPERYGHNFVAINPI